jgi:ribonuclease J
MTRLTFYGGVNEIGGNKILLEETDNNLFLDFGFPYKRHKMFFEEYLNPRGAAGLLDPLTMELIPPVEGLYRDDLYEPRLWDDFRDRPLYRTIGNIDGILLSHAHLDHSGHISLIKGDIPIYSTATTAFLVKAIQDSGKSGLEQQICYYNPNKYDIPPGWRQPSYTSDRSESGIQRQFRLGDIDPLVLSDESTNFWKYGFWEKTARQKQMNSQPLENDDLSGFNLKCLPVDHSIPGASAWAIETNSGWVVYSGDLRLHGKRSHLTRNFIEQAKSLKPEVLIIEGTNAGRDKNVSEQDIYDNATRIISGAEGLIIADFSPRDIDRLITFLRIAEEQDRKLAILPKDAYLLKTLGLLDPDIPDINENDNLYIYQKTTRASDLWVRNLIADYESKTVLADEIHSSQDEFILCFSFFDLNELPSIRPAEDSLYVFSSSEPHDEEQEIDFRRLHEWLRYFKFRSAGLPEEKDGKWEIPDNETGLHASGHASGTDLLDIVREIHPAKLIPVHSEQPEYFAEHLSGDDIAVLLPSPGGCIDI